MLNFTTTRFLRKLALCGALAAVCAPASRADGLDPVLAAFENPTPLLNLRLLGKWQRYSMMLAYAHYSRDEHGTTARKLWAEVDYVLNDQ